MTDQMSLSPAQVMARDCFDPRKSVVSSAEALAVAALAARASRTPVVVNLSGIGGVSSAYFNVLLLKIGHALGVQALQSDFQFVTESAAQKTIFDRSFHAVIAAIQSA